MKNFKLIFLLPVIVFAASSCNGDHSAQGGKDTAKNSYHVPRDTTKADSTGADTSSIDNSGSGGTKIPKADTSKTK